MIFEFTIVYQRKEGTKIREVLCSRLRDVLTANLNEFDDQTIKQMLDINFERRGEPRTDDTDGIIQRIVLCFTLDLPDETASARTVIDEFTGALIDPPVEHVVKFEDPLLHQELAQYAEEIFVLELKLRRVLSVIYLHGYIDGSPYDLLRDETVQPMSKEPPKPEQMKTVAENQFFHLTFSDYVGLNQRPDMKQIPVLLNMIRARESYEALRTELERRPISYENDAVFLASLRQLMDPIEKMRNCVAHNRRPSPKVTQNYINARPQVDTVLDRMLTRWQLDWQDEMPWDTAAREAVEQVLEAANWDEDAKTITLHNIHDNRLDKTVTNQEELEDYLRSEASTAFYAHCPLEDGEYLYSCNEDGIVEDVLSAFEERLAQFFAPLPE